MGWIKCEKPNDLQWFVAPVDQGQMVEISYAADWEAQLVYCRAYDRSDRSERYEKRNSEELQGDFDPWNQPPRFREGA